MVRVEVENVPAQNGLYVAYVDPDMDVPFSAKLLLMWMDGRWGYPGSDQNYRGTVYGWVGPLPAMRLSEPEKTFCPICGEADEREHLKSLLRYVMSSGDTLGLRSNETYTVHLNSKLFKAICEATK